VERSTKQSDRLREDVLLASALSPLYADGTCSPPLIIEVDLVLVPLDLVIDLLRPKLEALPLLIIIVQPRIGVHPRDTPAQCFHLLQLAAVICNSLHENLLEIGFFSASGELGWCPNPGLW